MIDLKGGIVRNRKAIPSRMRLIQHRQHTHPLTENMTMNHFFDDAFNDMPTP